MYPPNVLSRYPDGRVVEIRRAVPVLDVGRYRIDVHFHSSLASSDRDGIYASVNRTKPILHGKKHGERAFGCILESRVRV